MLRCNTFQSSQELLQVFWSAGESVYVDVRHGDGDSIKMNFPNLDQIYWGRLETEVLPQACTSSKSGSDFQQLVKNCQYLPEILSGLEQSRFVQNKTEFSEQKKNTFPQSKLGFEIINSQSKLGFWKVKVRKK